MKNVAREKIAKRFAEVEKGLGDKPFLTGDHFSVVDAYFFVMLVWAHHLKLDLKPYPKLEAYFQRMSSRPKVHAAMKAEGLVQ
jgi:glutathione S-transferase